MNGCARLSDRMPEVVHGRSRWTPDEAAHLAGCADCRRELALVQATVAMGRKAPRLTDPANLAATVERELVFLSSTQARRSRHAAGSGPGRDLLLPH